MKEIMLMNSKLVQYKNMGKQRASTLFQADGSMFNSNNNSSSGLEFPPVEKIGKLRPMGLLSLENKVKQNDKPVMINKTYYSK